jgi:hypothetical protein
MGENGGRKWELSMEIGIVSPKADVSGLLGDMGAAVE